MAATDQSREALSSEPSFSVVAPPVELPKGGGAIRGIGEKFAANPATGTGGVSVPIATTPGRSGFGPKLTLTYDSGAGNGVFGFGWSLDIPQIARSTAQGLPRYDDAQESDDFLLSGAEDLVPVVVDGTRHTDSSLYPGYTIHRYRPRIEGLFACIERWTRDADGDTHWRSISSDNILTLYGVTPEHRITAPDDSNRVFSWLISETRDAQGNAIAYSYQHDDDAGVDYGAPYESSRGGPNDPRRSVNRYLKRIRYGNRTSLLGPEPEYNRPPLLDDGWQDTADWMFELVFDYGDHNRDNPTPQPSKPWHYRLDAFSARRAGFEIRTTRRCQRVLMFHHFPELGVDDGCLVRSTDLHYLGEEADSGIYSFLASVTHSGWRRVGDTYVVRSMPPVEFEYSQPRISQQVKTADTSAGLPMGIDGATYQLVDLDGYGAAGVLTEQAENWYYSRNLSPLTPGEVVFSAPSPVTSRPNISLSSGKAQFIDLAGDGLLDVAVMNPPLPGFYEHDPSAGWAPFQPTRHALNRNLAAQNAKLIDITGDGLADVMVIDDNEIVWHESLGEQGFGPENTVWNTLEHQEGPRLIFTDPTSSVYLADMTGDGLTDLVHINNSGVCYWPSLGYGAFGPKVVMGSVTFDRADQFDPARVLLADIDGSGTNDVLYAGAQGIDLYFNASGNALLPPTRLSVFPQVSSGTQVATMDLNGDGTACLVWSSSLPADAASSLKYVELMAEGKPHLMVKVINNLGAETQVHYTTSTALAMQDDLDNNRWQTRVSFPVHVVDKVITRDHLSGNRFVSSYRYRDGYFDGSERELRGFGRVDQLDTEYIAALAESREVSPATNEAPEHNVPPVLTRTWFHTGALPSAGNLSRPQAQEYFSHPALDGWLLEDTLLPTVIEGSPLSDQEIREAVRALKGSVLRTEIYALDTPQATLDEPGMPYTVTEQNLEIVCLQRQDTQRHGVFFTHPRETITHHVERIPDDARTTHTLILEVDDYGNILQEVSVGYGRPPGPLQPGLTTHDQQIQQRIHISVTDHRFTNPLLDSVTAYRAPLPAEVITYELRKPVQEKMGDPGVVVPFGIDDLRQRIQEAADGHHDIAYEDLDFSRAIQAVQEDPSQSEQDFRRKLEQVQTRYRRDDLTGLLSLGAIESRALPGESLKLAFTQGLLDEVFTRDGEQLLPDPADVLSTRGGYVEDEAGSWWVPSGRSFFSPDHQATPAEELAFAAKHFFLPHRYQDPFGHSTTVHFDTYALTIVSSLDPLGNLETINTTDDNGHSAIRFDYRLLQPSWVTDPNGNRTRVAFDTLGMVVATATMGKPGDGEGDVIDPDFNVDLTQDQLDELYDATDPATQASHLLGNASTRIIYDQYRFMHSASQHPNQPHLWQPAYAATVARETHWNAVVPPHGQRFQLRFSYSDGLGREIQQKIQAETGPVEPGEAVASPRWVGSGWTIYNNKGKPVRQYEPFFSATHRYESGILAGVSPVWFYDPLERLIATLHPNDTFDKVVFSPWYQTTYDVNDTCAQPSLTPGEPPSTETGDPRTDPDISGYVADYFRTQPEEWQSWHAQRVDGALGTDEQNAAQRAAAHAATPSTVYADALGRSFLTIERNRVSCPDHDLDGEENNVTARVDLDIEGNQLSMRDKIQSADDPLGRIVVRYTYDMLGNLIHQFSMEAGPRWMLNDIAEQPIRVWDGRGHIFSTSYDALRRPVEQLVRGTNATRSDNRTLNKAVVVDRIEYGEKIENSASLNLRTRIYRHFDSAGVITNARLNTDGKPIEAFDFKGNRLGSTRRFVSAYTLLPDWSENPQLDGESFEDSAHYDALNRPIQSITPRSNLGHSRYNVLQPIFNESNLLERVDVWLEHPTAPEGLLDPADDALSPVGVTNIDYDAKGQRLRLDYKNEVSTFYSYDPLTFRLIQLRTQRNATAFHGDDPQPPDEEWPGKQLQNLRFTYDPIGNITHIHDDAQQTIFFKNKRVEPSNDYIYDALYRLVQATGRQHLGQGNSPIAHSPHDVGRVGVLSGTPAGRFAPNDGHAMGSYVERYIYDSVGNFLEMQHRGSDPAHQGWTRTYEHLEPSLIEDGTTGTAQKTSNRLTRTTLNPGGHSPQPEAYAHDAHGNLVHMPHLGDGQDGRNMDWDFQDQLHRIDKGGGGTVYYIYDASGQRVRKIWEKTPGLVEERIYLGSVEIFRRNGALLGPNSATLERETLHVMDDKQRIALVETRTVGTDPAPRQLIRYQLGNHLGSANLELDQHAQIITYEEYAPYGSTTYQAVRSQTETPKRYGYAGKERDEESGFGYHSARYYAPWLGRWISPDPTGLSGGHNLYLSCGGNPINRVDKSGSDWEFCNPFTDSSCGLRSTAEVVQEQSVDFGRGVWLGGKEAVVGLKDLGVGAYRVSLVGMLVDREQWEKSNRKLEETVSTIANDPGLVWDALKKPYVDAWEEGRPAEAFGRGFTEAVSLVLGAKGVDKLAKGSKLGAIASKADDVAKVADTASDLAKVTSKIDDVPKAAKAVSTVARLSEQALKGRADELAAELVKQGLKKGYGTVAVLQGEVDGKVVTLVSGNSERFNKALRPLLKEGEELVDPIFINRISEKTGKVLKSEREGIWVHAEQVVANEAVSRGLKKGLVATSNDACGPLCKPSFGVHGDLFPDIKHVNPSAR